MNGIYTLIGTTNETCVIMLAHLGRKCGAPAVLKCVAHGTTWYVCESCYELIRDRNAPSVQEMRIRSMAQ